MNGSMEALVLAEMYSDESNAEEDWNEVAIRSVMYDILDEVTLCLCFDIHRACKIGSYLLADTDRFSEKQYEIVDEKGVDVFGLVPTKKQYDCICPNCQRNLAASRFAPHLEKCMGMGRNSSRIASRRIQVSTGKKDSDESAPEDNHDDNDWSYLADRRGRLSKKLKREKISNSPRRTTKWSRRNANGDHGGSSAADATTFPYESMTLEEKRLLLTQTCGVISEHTKKMCTRSHRCPQHSFDQRKAVRLHLLGKATETVDDVQVDIDSYEEGDSQSLRDSLQWEVSSNPSPADSTSTTSSVTRRGGRGSSKAGRKPKSERSTPTNLYDFM